MSPVILGCVLYTSIDNCFVSHVHGGLCNSLILSCMSFSDLEHWNQGVAVFPHWRRLLVYLNIQEFSGSNKNTYKRGSP